MMDTLDYTRITEWVRGCYRPILISHRRPDGDAIGSLIGMALALRRLDLDPQPVLYDPLPARYAFFKPELRWFHWEDSREILEKECDAVVMLDTCALNQVEPIAEFLARAPRTLVIDHHATRDPIGMRDDDMRYFDETASATALIVAEWARHTGVPLTGTIAAALFTGIATDTGWFRFPNTDMRTMRMAADLVAAGVDVNDLYQKIYEQEPLAKLRLVAHLLTTMDLHADGRLAVMYVRKADFQRTGADPSMTEDLVNESGRLAGTEATLLFTEDDDLIRVNLRSKGRLDVSELARRFGGGGHQRAAGVRIPGKWDVVVPRFIAETIEAL